MPIDYSKLSDAALDQLSAEKADYSKLSDSDLEELSNPASDKYATTEQQIKTGLEGAVSGALPFGLGTAAEVALGVKPEDIQGRHEANPTTHAAGQIAGFAGSELIPGLGAANIASKATKGMSLAGKLAAEGALFQAGDELSKMISEDPHQSLGNALAQVGGAALLGGALGGTTSKLWTASSEAKLEKLAEGLKKRLNEHIGVPDPFTGQVGIKATDAVGKKAFQHGSKLADMLVEKAIAHSKGLSGALGAALGHFFKVGGYLGSLVGEKALQPLLESVIPALVKPLAATAKPSARGLKAAINYGMAVVKGETLLNKGAEAVFASGSGVLASHLIPSDKELDKLDDRAKAIEADPQNIIHVPGDLAHLLPDHGAVATEQASRMVEYLASQRPKPFTPAPLDKPIPPTKDQEQAYRRTLAIAEQPMMVLEHMKRGELIPKDLTDLSNLHPQVYKSLEQKLTGAAMDHMSNGGSIPYHTKISLSLFNGIPLDSTLTPQAIQSSQLTFLKQQQPAQPAQGVGKQSKSATSLTKAAQQYRTPGQTRDERRAEGK